MAVDVGQFLPHDQPEPKKKGQRRVPRIVRKPLMHFEISFLQHVRRVDAPRKPAVEPQPDHALQALAVVFEEDRQRRFVAGLGPAEQLFMFA